MLKSRPSPSGESADIALSRVSWIDPMVEATGAFSRTDIVSSQRTVHYILLAHQPTL